MLLAKLRILESFTILNMTDESYVYFDGYKKICDKSDRVSARLVTYKLLSNKWNPFSAPLVR